MFCCLIVFCFVFGCSVVWSFGRLVVFCLVVCDLLFGDWCLLPVARCSLFVVRCTLSVVGDLLLVVRCVCFVCWLLVVC